MQNCRDIEQVRRIKTLSLFSGAGGLDLGFHNAGFEILGCVEINSAYANSIGENRGKTFAAGLEIHCQDIRDFDPRTYLDKGIECVIGGPPCQTFSAAGRRSGGVLGTDDERGMLFKTYCSILDVLKPKAFVFENVYGLPGANNGGPWREIVKSFSELGYTLRAEVLDAADYGVPQHRERLIMVGHRSGEFQFPLPTHGPDSPHNIDLVTVGEAIADLQDTNEPFHSLDGKYGHLLADVPPGLNYAFFTREMGHPRPVFAWRSKFHDLLYKADPSTPCRTLKAQPGKFTGPFHWKNRHFTVAELKRLQSFPDDYRIIGSPTIIMEQIGNSVPPRLAETIAWSVRDQLFDAADNQRFPLRPHGFRSTFRTRQRERTKYYQEIATEAIRSRYGDIGQDNEATTRNRATHFVRAAGFFTKARVKRSPRNLTVDEVCYKISQTISSGHVTLEVGRVPDHDSTSRAVMTVKIQGLKKYLGKIDTLTAHLTMVDNSDVFHLWHAIQDSLVEQSEFFTLIDIYGHYANRGDAISVSTEINTNCPSPFLSALRFLGDSRNCGVFLDEDLLLREIGLTRPKLTQSISELRRLRFDVRTQHTHGTIRHDGVICTYPFPLLSQKAQIERPRNASQRDHVDVEAAQVALPLTS